MRRFNIAVSLVLSVLLNNSWNAYAHSPSGGGGGSRAGYAAAAARMAMYQNSFSNPYTNFYGMGVNRPGYGMQNVNNQNASNQNAGNSASQNANNCNYGNAGNYGNQYPGNMTSYSNNTSSVSPNGQVVTSNTRYMSDNSGNPVNNGSLTTPNLRGSSQVYPGFFANSTGSFYGGNYNGSGGYPVVPGNAYTSPRLPAAAASNVMANNSNNTNGYGGNGYGGNGYGGTAYGGYGAGDYGYGDYSPAWTSATANPFSYYFNNVPGTYSPGYGYGLNGNNSPYMSAPNNAGAGYTPPVDEFSYQPAAQPINSGMESSQTMLASGQSSEPQISTVGRSVGNGTLGVSDYDRNNVVRLGNSRNITPISYQGTKPSAMYAANNFINRPTQGRSAAMTWQLITYGDDHFSKKEYFDANDRYRSATRQTANVADAWFREGFAFAALGKYDNAAAAFRRGLHINPNWAAANFQLVDLYKDIAEKSDKLDAVVARAESQPNNADAALVAGIHLYFDGQAGRAAPFLQRAVEIAGDFPSVRGFLMAR